METKDGKKQDFYEQKPNMAVDVIQNIMGAFGKYQLWLCLLVFITKVFAGFFQMSIIFLAPRVSYYCEGSGVEECPCPDPVYNTSIFESTIVMDWDLICDKMWLVSFNQTIFQLGTLIGSIVYGVAADRYGRKNPILVAVTLQLITGVAASFTPNYWVFTIVRFLIGTTVGGVFVIGFVIIMEFVGTKYRAVTAALYQVPFNVGHMMLPLFSYFLRDYASFHLAISVPTAVMLSYYFLLPETPRWLLTVRRTEEAIFLLERVAKVNKRETGNIRRDVIAVQATLESNQLKRATTIGIFQTPNIRKRVIYLSLNWLACGYCFYGVSQYIGQLSGNIFMNVAASGGITAIGSLTCIPLTRYFGRKTIIIACSYICGLALIASIFSPEGVATVMFACVGVVCSTVAFVVIYLYTAELFPTVIRNAAVGYCSMVARVGSMIAPFVIDLEVFGAWLPPVVFAIVPSVAATMMFVLPETKDCELMTTMEEGERFGEKTLK